MFRKSRKAGTKVYSLGCPAAVQPWQPKEAGSLACSEAVRLGRVGGTSGFKVQASVGGGVSTEQCPLLCF